MKRGRKGKRGWRKNPGKTALYVVGGLFIGYLAYKWYQKSQAEKAAATLLSMR